MLAGMMARPRAISLRTNSGVTKSGIEAPKSSPSRMKGSSGLPAQIFADGDEFHLRRDDAAPGVFELRDACAGLGAQHARQGGKLRRELFRADIAVVDRLHGAAIDLLHIAARHHPGLARAGDALVDVDLASGSVYGPDGS